MSLTMSHGPLSGDPHEGNYVIQGPQHRLLFDDFPRRVRGLFDGTVVLDTQDGRLLHETGLLPRLYVPESDVSWDLLEATDHSTHCPFKGDASYWSARSGDRVATNAAWTYQSPFEPANWLKGHLSFYWDSLDEWFDEDEKVEGHLRDPYHRVDVRATSRHVRIAVDGEVVADSTNAKLLSETGVQNRYYVPTEDVRVDLLEPSTTETVCPYKGRAWYRSLSLGGRRWEDAAWFYPEPLENALKVRDHLSFDGAGISVEVDGRPPR